MATNNPFTITYNGTAIGGSSDSYQLLGPYVIDRGHRSMRVIFDVIVVATSASNLRSLCDTLETKFRERDKDLEIDIGATAWTWTAGTHYFNPTATITKTGNSETDRGLSRAYTIAIDAELPGDDTAENGLLEVRSVVSFAPSRQKTVTISGTYTATTDSTTASENYIADGDTRCNAILSDVDATATFELVEEDYDYDRNDANCTFTRQYVQLLSNQALGTLDDAGIKDHRVIFTDLSQHPEQSKESTQPLRRVNASYECSLDVEQGTDLQAVYESTVRPYVVDYFQTTFSPTVYCVEDRRISYDETTKRMSASLTFLYQKDGGEAVVRIQQSVAYRELRTIDYTPTHGGSEFEAYADLGWATLERVWTRTVVVLGEETPQRRLGVQPRYNEAGDFDSVNGVRIEGRSGVALSGWNIVSSTSQVTPQWWGDPTQDPQIQLTTLTETVVERYNDFPSRNGGGGTPTTPST